MFKKIKAINMYKVLLATIGIIILVLLVQSTINKKILFLKYGIVEGFHYGNYKVTKIEKIGTVYDYDIYIINTKQINSIENAWISSAYYYCYGDHRFTYDSDKISNIYFINNYKIYDLKEIIINKLIDSENLFNALPKTRTDHWLLLEELSYGELPECISID